MYVCLQHMRYNASHLALVMVVVILTMTIGTIYTKGFVEDFRENVSVQKSFTSDDSTEDEAGTSDYKPPKQSFVDYNCFFGCGIELPAYLPLISVLVFPEVHQAVPEVYPEVLAPPHPS
ncbi:hypothetical protein LPW11_00545 [Geomonas sp. RF6]|uniref:hypothetical protein n=1 Tax=Geomonas sp. RF6 TaxID=2897342 RepID=UPI001E62FA63|nr:hypothetical protein [Geomonas sp. RF6]UFS70694.1 hypothetical protein LPW11_00545 [Geomonas sp. RF6]